MKDVTEFLASIELNPDMGELHGAVTYQDSCHLAHGQKIRKRRGSLLRAIPGLKFREMPLVPISAAAAPASTTSLHTEMAMEILERRWRA